MPNCAVITCKKRSNKVNYSKDGISFHMFLRKMEDQLIVGDSEYCLGCLRSSLEFKIQDYKIQFAHFWAIFEEGSIKLCYICRRLAQHAELFIQNVQSNQILLQNCLGDLSATIEEAFLQLQNPITLNTSRLDPITLAGKCNFDTKSNNIDTSDYKHKDKHVTDCKSKKKEKSEPNANKEFKIPLINPVIICDSAKSDENEFAIQDNENETELRNDIKVELKVEEGFNHLDVDFGIENEDLQDQYVKEEYDDEDEYPLHLLKDKVEAIDLASIRTSIRNPKKERVKKERLKLKGLAKLKVKGLARREAELQCNEALSIMKIYLTKEEAMEERRQQALDPVYLNCSYKCENCLKGFNFKAAYDKHLKRHSEETGEYVCDICKIRMDKRDTWLSHKKCHDVRWKCMLCGLVRTSRSTLVDHHNAVHKQGGSLFACPYCPKTFKRQMSQRKHVRYTHVNKERVTCAYCKKTYANKEVIKAHMMVKHPKEVSALGQVKKYPCEECGMMFRSPTHLKMHGYKHSMTRDYYCVECDKAFKSEAALKQHLKTTQIHVTYSELPLCCDQCDKRFAIKRDLDRHMNSVHLEVKPFKCDRCDKAYVSNWSLRDHARTAHEGYKRPLRYPCKFCDKIFDRSSILKAHIRTHTGERPYQCDKCPAQFSQSGVLATHNKLIHQRLTRDGKPKQSLGK